MKAALMRTGARRRNRTRSSNAPARASKGWSYTLGPDGKWVRTDSGSDGEQGRNEENDEGEEEEGDDGDDDDDDWLRGLVDDVNASLFVDHNRKQYNHKVVQSQPKVGLGDSSEGITDDEIGAVTDNKEHADFGNPNDIVGISECGKIHPTPFGVRYLPVRCFLPRQDVVSVVEEFAAAGVQCVYSARDFHRSISRPRLILRGEDRLSGNPIRRESGRDDLSSGKATRTGTLPFMAISALNSDIGPNKYYHDLESLFYLFVWVCIAGGEFNSRLGINNQGQNQDRHFHQAKKPSPSPPLLAIWSGRALRLDRPTPHSVTVLKLKDISREKREVLTDSREFESRVVGCIPECFEPVCEMMREIRCLLFRAMLEEEEEEGQRGRGRRGRTLQYEMPVKPRRDAGAGDVFRAFADILTREVERLQLSEEVEVEEVGTGDTGTHLPGESSLTPRQSKVNENAIPGSVNEDVNIGIIGKTMVLI